MNRVIATACCIFVTLIGLTGCTSSSEEFFNSNGTVLSFTDEGEGDPIILVHGFGGDKQVWDSIGIREILLPCYRVIALDSRGHGHSEKPTDPGDYGVEMVDDIVRLMDHLGISRAHVVGNSLGGYITLKLAMLHPDRLLTATLCDSGWVEPSSGLDRQYEVLGGLMQEGSGFAYLLASLFPGSGFSPAQSFVIDTTLSIVRKEESLGAVITAFPEFAVERQELLLNNLPLLAITGTEDPGYPSILELGEITPGARVVVVEGGTHATVPASMEFRTSLVDFLADES